ncbi:hypothetical protein TNCV_221521 [Trichonephila clavipes]|nr:hypothetical protein TNCV_221521 [Trichonephila clavipes]
MNHGILTTKLLMMYLLMEKKLNHVRLAIGHEFLQDYPHKWERQIQIPARFHGLSHFPLPIGLGITSKICPAVILTCPDLHESELRDFQMLSISYFVEGKNDKIGEIGDVIEEVVGLARQINLEVGSDDSQELLDSTIWSHKG